MGLLIARIAKELSRAFEQALAEAGGSQPVWMILMSLKIKPDSTQRQLAETVGIREATITHHLNGMEKAGLITRRRDPANRRVHQLTLTEDGEAAFHRLRAAAMGFDRRLRSDVPDEQIEAMTETLGRLAANVAAPDSTSAELE